MKTIRLLLMLAVQVFMAWACYVHPEHRRILLIGIIGLSAIMLLVSRRLRSAKDAPKNPVGEILSMEAGSLRFGVEANRAEVFGRPLAVVIVTLAGQDSARWSTLNEIDKVAIASHAGDILLQEVANYDAVIDCGTGRFLVLLPEMNTTAIDLADELREKLSTKAPGGTDFRASMLVEIYKPGGTALEFVRQVRAVMEALD